MILLTPSQREQLLDNGRRQAAVKGTPDELDFAPVVKLFKPVRCRHLAPHRDRSRRRNRRLGSLRSRHGLPRVRDGQPHGACAEYYGQFGLGIERDLHFTARGPISVYIDAANDAGHIIENIPRCEVTN